MQLVFLIVLIFFVGVFAFLYEEGNDIRIIYHIFFKALCYRDAIILSSFVGLPLGRCVKECAFRPHCTSLMFHRRSRLCELLEQAGVDTITNGDCVYISASDIVAEKIPCTNCTENQACDSRLKYCTYKECGMKRTNNVTIKGNMNHVDDMVQFQCDHGYTRPAMCGHNGTWNHTTDCQTFNLALGKPTTMSSTYMTNPYPAGYGVDGDVSTYFHTLFESYPWWRVDLERSCHIVNVTIYNRPDCCQSRAIHLVLKLGNAPDSMMTYDNLQVLQIKKTFTIPANTQARFVEVQIQTTDYFHLGEVEVIGIPN